MSLAAVFPIILAVHIALAVSLFLPSLLLPFAVRSRRPGVTPAGRIARGLLWLQSTGSAIIGVGLAGTGAAPALRQLPHGRSGRAYRLSHVRQAAAVGGDIDLSRAGLPSAMG